MKRGSLALWFIALVIAYLLIHAVLEELNFRNLIRQAVEKGPSDKVKVQYKEVPE